jgi:peptidoglycan/LPS O-acetylase OafA/YrhL
VRSSLFPESLNLATFSSAFDPKRNAFAFMRMALAVLVIFSHSYLIGGFGVDPLAAITGMAHTFGEVAVALFFVLSGFLVTRSGLRLPSIGRFLWHRWLRIFPGYWVCLLICACVFAPCFLMLEYGESYSSVFSAPWDPPHEFVLKNAALFHVDAFTINGVMNQRPVNIARLLRHNPFPNGFNGSLWSLPYEFACYLAIGALLAAGVLQRWRRAIIGVFVGSWGLYAFERLSPTLFNECLPFAIGPLVMVGAYFSAGSLCFLYRKAIPFSTQLFVLSIVSMAGALMLGAFSVVAPVAMSYAFMWLAFKLPVTRFDAHGDWSYGTYIYAFPVQQGLVLLAVHEQGLAAYVASSVLVTLVFAVLSYRLVEAPCLRLKNIDVASVIRKIITRTAPSTITEPSDCSSIRLDGFEKTPTRVLWDTYQM